MHSNTTALSRRSPHLPLLALAGLLLAGAATAEEGWTELFNGRDLTGWTQLGGTAQYRVHEGAIEGLSTPSKQNTFLVSDATYRDFILELEFKVDAKTNSGVQIRSESHSETNNGRVHGTRSKSTLLPALGQAVSTMRRGAAGSTPSTSTRRLGKRSGRPNGTPCGSSVSARAFARGSTEFRRRISSTT